MFTLRQSITNSQTEISVNEIITGDAASQEGLLEIGTEVIRYTNRDLHTFIGCTRGYSGTVAATHARGADVTVKAISDADVRVTNVRVFTTEMGETLDYTLETPDNPGQTLVLAACHSASSSGDLTVNTVQINAGESKEFTWDGNSWVVETDSTGTSGITQLTGEITAGPGSGSQAASLASPFPNDITLADTQSLFLNTAETIFVKGVNGKGIQISDTNCIFGSNTNDFLCISLSEDQSQAAIVFNNVLTRAIDMYSLNLEMTFNDTANEIKLNGFGPATDIAKFDLSVVAGETRFMLWDVDTATLQRVTVGAADSGGLGFKVLRIPN